MRKILRLLGGIMIIITLSSCSSNATGVRGVILPHHNLVSDYIDEFYESISDEDIDRIILISTNHFDLGYGAIQSTYDIDSSVDLDDDFIEEMEEKGILSTGDMSFNVEHGIMVHINRIEEYFSGVDVVPIVIKWKVPVEDLDKLIDGILEEGDMDSTLVIASIDFSHYVTEETAIKNDERTMEWLKNWGANGGNVGLDELWKLEKSFSIDTEKATALDSPETLYVFTKLMGDPEELEIWERTSSAANFGATDPLQNTSHLFVKVF